MTSSLNPLAGVIEQFAGTPASAQELEECGPVAADVATDTSAGAGTDATVELDPGLVVDNLPPLGPGDIPFDIPTVPPIGDPTGDPTGDPEPPADPEQPTDPEPPVDESEGDLIGADVNLAGEDLLDLGILDGACWASVWTASTPTARERGNGITVDLNGEEIATVDADPQEEGVVDVNINGEDPTSNLEADEIGGIVEDILGGDPLGDVIGDDPVTDLLGDDLLGGLLN